MNEQNLSSSVESTTTLNEPNSSQLGETMSNFIGRVSSNGVSFLKGISIAGSTLAAGAMGEKLSAQTIRSSPQFS